MLKYSISYKNPLSQLINISFKVPTEGKKRINFKLPNWRPGRYQIQNFPKRIKSISAFSPDGVNLEIQKLNKSTWQVDTHGIDVVEIRYEYYAAAMDAGNSWLDEEQLYLNFINCMLYVDDFINEALEVKLDLPDSYKIACGLESPEKHTLKSPSFYRLVDSPLFASANLRHVAFKNSSIQFNIWIQGDLEISDEQLIKDFDSYTSKQIEVMGEFPCQEYHYLFQILSYKHYHGVEHWNSTVITLGPSERIAKREGYLDLLGVSSHELFHTWNVIRLRPKEMTPYNFESENYHTTGFITEGVTTYYGDLFLARSGVFSLDEYLAELNKMLKRHYENEGRLNMSVADSSFDLWLDGYEIGVPGRKVSIYNEGALAALILDLTIRIKFNNKKSLDDVMRMMWSRHGKNETGYSSNDYKNVAEEIYEESLDTYFGEIIFGTKPFETYLESLFNAFGLAFELKESAIHNERLFGFRLLNGKVIDIASGSPASEQLMIGDELSKVNGKLIDEADFNTKSLALELKRFGRDVQTELEQTPNAFFSVYQVSHVVSNDLQLGWLENCKK